MGPRVHPSPLKGSQKTKGALRLEKFRVLLKSRGLSAFLLTHPANISYLTEYQSRDSFLLVSASAAVYFTDSRYIMEASGVLSSQVDIQPLSGDFFSVFEKTVKRLWVRRIGFEQAHLSYAFYMKLRKAAGAGRALVAAGGLVEGMRLIKEKKEIEAIRRAVGITGRAYALIRRVLRPGITELEVVGELERIIRREGAEASSFDIIVASGANASFPHHLSGRRKLRSGECVVIDMGVRFHGYSSDLTRTFFLGKINSLVQRVYDCVRHAQDEALSLIKPGVSAALIDRAARSYIARQGYGEYFGHNLGHGVGLEVHEAPSISRLSSSQISPGMLFTIEPGIYLPDRFGIRIEDMVLVTRKGKEVLSGFIHK